MRGLYEMTTAVTVQIVHLVDLAFLKKSKHVTLIQYSMGDIKIQDAFMNCQNTKPLEYKYIYKIYISWTRKASRWHA